MNHRSQILLCFDFDGTLVDPMRKQSFPSDLGKRLRALREEHAAVFVINTGRTLFQTLSGLSDYGVSPHPDFIIAQEREIYEPGQFNRWVALGDWNKRIEREHRKLLRTARRFFKRTREFLRSETSAQVQEHDHGIDGITAESEDEMDRICAYLDREVPLVKDLGYHRNSVYLRFGHRSHNKGSAMNELGNTLGIPPEFRLAAGDNYNDLRMLDRSYAHGVACPGNALPKVKETVQSQGGFVANAEFGHGMIETLDHFLFPAPRR